MMPSYLDHLYAFLVFVAIPAHSAMYFRQVLGEIRRGGERVRVATYQQIVATWAVMALILVLGWWYSGRAWPAIGVVLPEPVPLLVGAFATVVVLAIFLHPLRTAAQAPSAAERIEDHLGELGLLMPFNQREERWFRLVSFNAGVTEELVFRGYLIWYLSHYMTELVAAVIAIAAFALAHLYQGTRHLPSLILVSAFAVALYLGTGSLLLPIIAHFVLDAMQGYYFMRIRQARAAANEDEAVSDSI